MKIKKWIYYLHTNVLNIIITCENHYHFCPNPNTKTQNIINSNHTNKYNKKNKPNTSPIGKPEFDKLYQFGNDSIVHQYVVSPSAFTIRPWFPFRHVPHGKGVGFPGSGNFPRSENSRTRSFFYGLVESVVSSFVGVRYARFYCIFISFYVCVRFIYIFALVWSSLYYVVSVYTN